MDAEQVLAFRLARSGLAGRDAGTLRDAAACPASDFARDAALLALAARHADVTRAGYDEAVDGGDLVLAHIVRGAIHALRPADLALYGRALISSDDDELAAQLGRQVQLLAAEHGFAPTDALDEVAEATKGALRGGRALSKNELHDELRDRVRAELLPWCKGCKSHHVAPMLWRYAGVKAGARLDSERRYLLGKPGRTPAAGEAVARFLRFYGPADAKDFAEWAGVAGSHAKRLFERVEGDLSEVAIGGRSAWALTRGPEGARVAAGRERRPPDSPRRPLPAEAQPSAPRSRRRASQAAVPAGGEPRSGVEGRKARRALAGEGEGAEGRGHGREARAGRPQGPRARGEAHRRAPRRVRAAAQRRLSRARIGPDAYSARPLVNRVLAGTFRT